MNKGFLILLFVLPGIVSSCTIINSFSVDQMSPADISLPSEIRKVAIVNNLPWPPYRWPENFTWKDTDKVIEGDGQLMAEGLAQHIADGNFFDEVFICDSALRKNDQTRRTSPLKQEEVRKLSDDLGADAIISVDGIFLQATPTQVYLYEEESIAGAINTNIGIITRIYIPSRKEPLTTLSDLDSIFWYTPYINQDEIIKNGSDFAATLPVKHLIPTWKTVERYYYTGGSVDLRDAAISLKENSWDDALIAWKRIYNSKSKKKQKYAAFNMALYYELHDDFDEAEKWLKTAIELVPDAKKITQEESSEFKLMQDYLAELEKRKIESLKLKIQMNRFQDIF